MERLRAAVRPGVSTLEIDAEVEAFIRGRGALPAFKGYRGFPATVCVSINEEVVHGIPSARRQISAGDIVGLELGSNVGGAYVDYYFTVFSLYVASRGYKFLIMTRKRIE